MRWTGRDTLIVVYIVCLLLAGVGAAVVQTGWLMQGGR